MRTRGTVRSWIFAALRAGECDLAVAFTYAGTDVARGEEDLDIFVTRHLLDDEVLIGFLFGDVNMPYVVGGLYNGKDKPPKTDDITGTFAGEGYDHGKYATKAGHFNEDGKNDLRFIRSRSGHLFIFDDKENAEKITLADALANLEAAHERAQETRSALEAELVKWGLSA